MLPDTRLELTGEEQHFLTLVAPLGLDWITLRADFLQRHGKSSYHGWRDIIALPPSTALSRSPLEFVMYTDADTMDLPPEYLWADFMPYDEARRNHRELEQQLQATFGSPLVENTSNCLVRIWSFGVFKVSQHTFPPDIQDPALARPGSNPLLDRNPKLRTASSVKLESEYAQVYPDARLIAVAKFVQKKKQGFGPANTHVLATHSPEGKIRAFTPRRETRRNPLELSNLIAGNSLVGWRDESTNRIGISAKRDSLVFAPSPTSKLILIHKEPARGPGGYALDFQSSDHGSPSSSRLNLLEGGFTDSIETTAGQLSEVWQVAITRETGLDD